jgi:hypothetical protein
MLLGELRQEMQAAEPRQALIFAGKLTHDPEVALRVARPDARRFQAVGNLFCLLKDKVTTGRVTIVVA